MPKNENKHLNLKRGERRLQEKGIHHQATIEETKTPK
jgi:hypothetical protein